MIPPRPLGLCILNGLAAILILEFDRRKRYAVDLQHEIDADCRIVRTEMPLTDKLADVLLVLLVQKIIEPVLRLEGDHKELPAAGMEPVTQDVDEPVCGNRILKLAIERPGNVEPAARALERLPLTRLRQLHKTNEDVEIDTEFGRLKPARAALPLPAKLGRHQLLDVRLELPFVILYRHEGASSLQTDLIASSSIFSGFIP